MSLYLLIIMIIALLILIPIGIIYLIIRLVKYNKKLREQNSVMFQQFNNQNNLFFFGDDQTTNRQTTDYTQQITPDINTEIVYRQKLVNETPKIKREPLGSSAIMLIIGVILMVLSGITFAVANWVNMTPLGRVGVILIATTVSFLISFMFKKAAKLNNTSSSFYILGFLLISVSVLSIGIYKLFGEWYSFSGNGLGILLATSSLISSIGAFIGNKIYKTKVFLYTGLYLANATLTFTAFEATYIINYDPFGVFAFILIIIQMITTASIHIFEVNKNFKYSNIITTVSDVVAVLYALIGIVYVIKNFENSNRSTIFILSVIIVQLIIYGILKNKKWMLGAQSLLSVYNVVQISRYLSSRFSEEKHTTMLLVFFLSSIYFINNFVPKIKNTFSTLIGLITLFIATSISLLEIHEIPVIITLIIPITTMIVVYIYAFNPNKTIQSFAGVFSTVTPLLIMSELAGKYKTYITELTRTDDLIFALTSFLLSIIPLIIMNIDKIAPKFSKNYPLKSNKVLYSNVISSGIILVTALYYPQLIFLHFAAVAINVYLSLKMKNNISLVLPIIWLYAYIGNLSSNHIKNNDNLIAVIFFIIFILIMSLSATVFRKAFVTRKNGKTQVDIPLITNWIVIIELSYYDDLGAFLSVTAFAIYVSCFAKTSLNKNVSSVIYSVSSVITAWALITRPFLVPETNIISNKITLGIIALTGLAFKYIWIHNAKFAKSISNFVYITAFIELLLDAVEYSSAGNTLFVLCVITLILILAFICKSKTWFIVSVVSMIFIIGYVSREYLTTLSWWVYLFVAGIVFISIAALNEYLKQKGETVKSRISNIFLGWNW